MWGAGMIPKISSCCAPPRALSYSRMALGVCRSSCISATPETTSGGRSTWRLRNDAKVPRGVYADVKELEIIYVWTEWMLDQHQWLQYIFTNHFDVDKRWTYFDLSLNCDWLLARCGHGHVWPSFFAVLAHLSSLKQRQGWASFVWIDCSWTETFSPLSCGQAMMTHHGVSMGQTETEAEREAALKQGKVGFSMVVCQTFQKLLRALKHSLWMWDIHNCLHFSY